MATLEEVSAQLTKPAKDLANWNFPLATVLQEYYTLLNEQDQVNFSNAALVLQNSVNVYVRRIEYLAHDTNVLIETFADHDAEDMARKEAKKRAKDKNTLIDFGDFEAIDFTKFVGKNNNIKARVGTKNSVKLLGQRFPQLENARSSLPIDVYDIHGEIVGKKYDFRCNEYLTASGMLVDHLTPEDFLEQNADISTQEAQETISETQETIPETQETIPETQETIPETEESGIDLITSLQLTSPSEMHSSTGEQDLCQNDCEDACVVHDKDTGLLDASFASSFDSGVGSSIQSSSRRPDSSLSNYEDSNCEPLPSRPGSSMSTIDENSLVGAVTLPLDISQNARTSVEETVQDTRKRSIEASQSEDSLLDNHRIEDKENTANCATVTEAGCAMKNSQEVAVSQARRSKRLKNVIDATNNLNPKQWEPIPFNGVPDTPLSSRSEFKLPCPVSLLKSKEKPRKRKSTTEMQKKRSLKKLAMVESGTPRKKLTMYSPTRQLFHPFKKEELEDFQSCFEERFKNRVVLNFEAVTDTSMDLLGFQEIPQIQKSDRGAVPSVKPGIDEIPSTDACFEEPLEKRSKIDVTNYETVTNISMDLLGFMTSIPKSDPVIRGIVAGTVDHTENIEPVDSFVDDFQMPYTPESSDSSSDMPPTTPTPTYHSRIEQSVRDIYQSADVRTEQEEAVARWHEFMKPKLKEAEHRQERRPFDVKQYSALVIEKMTAKDDGQIKFKEVVDRQEPAEVARYFLASLQLANKYNLRIDTSHDNAEGNFTLVLLDKDR